MTDDERMAQLVAAIIAAFHIGMAASPADLDEAMRSVNYLIRQIREVRPDLYDHLKARAQARRAVFDKDARHG